MELDKITNFIDQIEKFNVLKKYFVCGKIKNILDKAESLTLFLPNKQAFYNLIYKYFYGNIPNDNVIITMLLNHIYTSNIDLSKSNTGLKLKSALNKSIYVKIINNLAYLSNFETDTQILKKYNMNNNNLIVYEVSNILYSKEFSNDNINYDNISFTIPKILNIKGMNPVEIYSMPPDKSKFVPKINPIYETPDIYNYNVPWIVNENNIFELNDNMEIKIEEVGIYKHKVIVIDNFYKRPEEVRRLILNSPSTRDKNIIKNYPGARHVMQLNITMVIKFLLNLIQTTYGYSDIFEDIKHNNNFICNLYKHCMESSGQCSMPHSDPVLFAAVVYLNLPEECTGGTSIYKHKETKLEILPYSNKFYKLTSDDEVAHLYNVYKSICDLAEPKIDIINKDVINLSDIINRFIYRNDLSHDFITESNNNWELLKILEMKWNRLVLYPGFLFHSPYIKDDMFINNYRINQAIFISTKYDSNLSI